MHAIDPTTAISRDTASSILRGYLVDVVHDEHI
jgi:hypothetical protein